jgi:hypothetical protein
MTTIRTVATHELVQRAYPRTPTERDELGMAVGRAIDAALSRYSHEAGQHLRPTASAMHRFATDELDRELADADLTVPEPDRAKILAQVADVLQAFRKSELFGLSRPRSRLILIDGRVGVYAQPDYWDRRARFFEMKSYRAVPPPPEVELQLTYFRLAFPGFQGILACFDRHASPVQTTLYQVPPLAPEAAREALRQAYKAGLELGQEKVLEYVDNPVVRYELAGAAAGASPAAPGAGPGPSTPGTGGASRSAGPPSP